MFVSLEQAEIRREECRKWKHIGKGNPLVASLIPAGLSQGSIIKSNYVTPLKTSGPAGPAVLVPEPAF